MKRTPLDSSLDCQTARYTKCISGFLLTILSPLSKKHTPHNKVHNSPIWKTDSPKNIPGDKRGQINKALQETWHTLAPLCRTLHKRDQINKALQETWHTLAPLCRTLHTASRRGEAGSHCLSPLVLFQYQPHNEVADADADHLHGGGESHGCAHCRLAHHQRNGGPHAGLKNKIK